MTVVLRTGVPGDAEICGSICFEAFRAISSEHNFPWDLPSAEIGIELVRGLLTNPGFHSVVAEVDGKVVGSNFLDERGPIGGIGPITVDPAVQNRGVGRRLMVALLDRAAESRLASVRLLQSAYHNRSLCLYTDLGFDSREAVSKIDGEPLGIKFRGYDVRPAEEADLSECNALCQRVHGHDRSGELRDAVAQGTARIVEHLGKIIAYDWCGAGFSRRRVLGANAQWRTVPLVFAQRAAPRSSDDLDDDRPLQRAGGCVSPVGAVLTRMAHGVGRW